MDECRRTPAGGRADDVHAVPGDHADLRGLRRPDAPRGGGLRHVRRGLYDAAKQANISGTIVHKATIDKNAEKTSTRFAKSWGGGILKTFTGGRFLPVFEPRPFSSSFPVANLPRIA